MKSKANALKEGYSDLPGSLTYSHPAEQLSQLYWLQTEEKPRAALRYPAV